MEPVRLGILSTARINHAVLVPARETDKATVLAVASRDAARAETYAAEHGVERAYGSYEELLGDSDVEAVYVSLPNSLHVDWAIRALEAGKHVLVEKSFSAEPAEVERAFDAADRAGRLLMEAFMYRHHPQTRKLAEVVQAGEIGELRQLRSSFSFTLDHPDDVRWRPELGGGALLDLGCYCVSVIRLLAGEPGLVSGFARTAPTGVDAAFSGLLQFPGEVLAEFHCAYDLPEASGLEAIGSQGTVVVPEPFHCRDPHLQVNGKRIDVADIDRYLLQLENFCDAIRGEGEPLLDREDAVGQARTLAGLFRSAESVAAVVP
jgi:D-xylose 1-dehydrogenase (NADP+, D-xylono-1,5-lactone-forming)